MNVKMGISRELENCQIKPAGRVNRAADDTATAATRVSADAATDVTTTTALTYSNIAGYSISVHQMIVQGQGRS